MTDEELERQLTPVARQLAAVLERLEQDDDLINWTYLDVAMFAIQRCLDTGGTLMSELTKIRASRIN